jgi:hypothetical protein
MKTDANSFFSFEENKEETPLLTIKHEVIEGTGLCGELPCGVMP